MIEIAETLRRVTGSAAPVKSFPWLLVRLAAPVYPLARESAQMRHLWHALLQLDIVKLIAFLGSEPHIALQEAVHTVVAGLRQDWSLYQHG